MTTNVSKFVTATEAASVTGVPLRQVHRIIDAGLLEGAVLQRRNARLLAPKALLGLRLAHQTANVLTLASRRAVVAAAIRRPRQSTIRADSVVVETQAAAQAVRSGLDRLAKARRMVASSPDVLGGVPVFKGTRIPVHDVADMLANGDRPAAIVGAYPRLNEAMVQAAAAYAEAYPRRGRPRAKPKWRSRPPKESKRFTLDGVEIR